MLVVQCLGKDCRKVAFAQDHSNPDAFLDCPCCTENHDHAAAANSCLGQHEGAECPDGPDCIKVTPAGEDCPGGHCAKGVDGCTVCRPISVTLPPGQVSLYPAAGVAEALEAARGF